MHTAQQFLPPIGDHCATAPPLQAGKVVLPDRYPDFIGGMPDAILPPASDPDHAARKHHRYSVSKLDYYDACAGFESDNKTSEAAEDGTRLHEIMEKICRRASPSALASNVLAGVLEKETVSDEEESYLRFCCKELDFWLTRNSRKLEHELKVSIFKPDGEELTNGHLDLLVFVTPETGVLLDWKFGWLPVPAADVNLQGMGYAAGCFQRFPQLRKLGVEFVQPKLLRITRCSYRREQAAGMAARIQGVIDKARRGQKTLRPNPYCDYCAAAGRCTGLVNNAAIAVAQFERLPMPSTFEGLQITTAEDAAKALYVIDRLENLIRESGVKERAKEILRTTEGRKLTVALGEDRILTMELREKKKARSANSPGLIAEALKEFLSPEEVLGACDPQITKLEDIFAGVFVAKRNAEAGELIARAGRLANQCADANEGAAIRSAAKAEAKLMRTTKKQAVEILNSTLLSEGLITAPEGTVEYLKVRVEKQAKQITQKSNGHSNITTA